MDDETLQALLDTLTNHGKAIEQLYVLFLVLALVYLSLAISLVVRFI